MNIRASQVTRVTLDADRTIESGHTITVFGIIVANSTENTAEVDIEDGTGNKQITIVVPCYSSERLTTEYVADNGLVIDSIGSANVTVTVFHSHGGS